MNRYEDYGPTVLRIALGVIFLAHSAYLKVMVFTVPGTVGFFQSLGLPGFAAYATMAAEIIGGVALILGWRVREAAAVLTVVSLGATWVHSGAGWLFTNEGGGWEYPLFLAVTSFVLVLTGPGALALGRKRSPALAAG
ncbi:DoxX family protein [Marinihelvus fidelis]|uniref:DoxX family protein n=1 Tax=Marinihelvus fidelis TaxID=2613842 RepID=A0A5N0T5Y2_9GAMM|nr:DoxX family protein [Marinihelvus fidelis]KAA9130188.1 DoxX family protein [Marinihelvus fidelis]